MKINLKSPSAGVINSNRDKIIKYARVIFKEHYKFFKKEIIQAIQQNKQIDLQNHKKDFQNILRLIFKKIINTNPNTIFHNKNLIIKTKDKIDFTKQQDEWYDILNKQLDQIANNRTNLIFSNLIGRIDNLLSSSKKDVIQEMQNINNTIQEKQSILNQLMFINTLEANKTKQELKNNIDKLQSKLKEQTLKEKYNIIQNFSQRYDNDIVENKSNLHAQNEVDSFDEQSRQGEVNILKQTAFLTVGNNIINIISKNLVAEWINPLDERSRITHAEAHGQKRKIGQLFEITNPITGNIEYTSRPRGEGLTPENSINCRCVLNYNIEFILDNSNIIGISE
jgi:hypothetical protein